MVLSPDETYLLAANSVGALVYKVILSGPTLYSYSLVIINAEKLDISPNSNLILVAGNPNKYALFDLSFNVIQGAYTYKNQPMNANFISNT